MKKIVPIGIRGMILVAVWLIFGACGDKKDGPFVSGEIQSRNAFAQLLMTDVYLWSDQAAQVIEDQQLDFRTEPDPIQFYQKLRHPDDRWSEMTSDVNSLQQQFSGTLTTFGYSLLPVRFVDASNEPTGEYCAIVLYVYADTPAEKAGLKRGDILLGVNGSAITADNYNDLYYTPSVKIDLGVYDSQAVRPKGESVSMTAVRMYEDPIIFHEVLERDGKKIGYLFYSNYLLGTDENPYQALDDLFAVFSGFQNRGVDEVVLDLRYNGGGYAKTAEVLCNILAPRSALTAGDVMNVEQWNAKYSSLGESSHYGPVVEIQQGDGSLAKIPISVNINLNRLYVLTSGNTASASESTMIGLKPYLNLTQIGTSTHGKYCGGIVLSRSSYSSTKNIAELENWGAYTMVYRFTNKENITFVNGLAPQHTVSENIFDLAPIGDPSDPLLAKALELITGRPSQAVRSVSGETPPYIPMPDARIKANDLDGKMIDLRMPENFKEIR